MRVAVVIVGMEAGGAERVTANLANAWVERGHEVDLITLTAEETDFYELDPRIRRHALDLVSDSRDVLQAMRAGTSRTLALRRRLKAIGPDIVVAMATTAAVFSILASRGLGLRVIVAEHIYPPMLPMGRVWERLRRLTYPHAFRVVMLTSEGLEWLRSCIPRARGAVIPNPVSVPIAVTDPVVAPYDLAPEHRRLILAVGRLVPQKGFDLAVEAFAAVAHRFPEWDLVILGDGPDRLDLETQIKAHGLGTRILVPGVVGNIADWYQRADLFLMSSRFEGFPMTLAEALAYGCPAVSYDCDTGPRDLVEHDVSGLLVRQVGDVAALSDALATLMEDESKRRTMAARAVAVRDRYGPERILALWDRLFSTVSGSPAG